MEEPPVGDTTAEWPGPSQFGPYLLKRLWRGGFGEVVNNDNTVSVIEPGLS